MRTKIAWLILCLSVAGCSRESASVENVTPSQLNSNSARYNGKIVSVTGFILLGPDAHDIYESEALHAELKKRWVANDPGFNPVQYLNYCLTIINPDIFYKNIKSLAGKTLTLRGRFVDNYLDEDGLNLGSCTLPTGLFIDEADLKQRYASLLTSH
jgi:hypothetical protein